MMIVFLPKKHNRSLKHMGNAAEKQDELVASITSWVWPLDETRYDRTPIFTSAEREALASFVRRPRDRTVVVAMAEQQETLARLLAPLRDTLPLFQAQHRFNIRTL